MSETTDKSITGPATPPSPGRADKPRSEKEREHSQSRHHRRHHSRSHSRREESRHHSRRHHHHRHSRSRSPDKDKDKDKDGQRKRRGESRDRERGSAGSGGLPPPPPPPQPPRRRASGWDAAPVECGPIVNGTGGFAAMGGQAPGPGPQSQPGMGGLFSGPDLIAYGGCNETQAKRLYIGNVTAELGEQTLIEWVNALMIRGKLTTSPGNPVVGAIMHPEKTYAFLDFRCPDEATAALSLDGLKYGGNTLRFRRPTDYRPPIIVDGGRGAPQLSEEMRKELGFSAVPSAVPDSPEKMYIGGLPASLTEEQVIELLSKCGELAAFDLIRDYQTGVSRGYAFFMYKDPEESNPKAIDNFNGIQMGGKTLFVQLASHGAKPRLATGSSSGDNSATAEALAQMQLQTQMQQQQTLQPRDMENPSVQMLLDFTFPADKMISTMVKAFSDKARGTYKEESESERPIIADTNNVPDSDPTPVLQIANMASGQEINSGPFYENLLEDVRMLFSTYGNIVSIHIPRTMERVVPGQPRFEAPLIGQERVFVEFEDAAAAGRAQQAIKYRCYNGRALITKFVPLSDYRRIIATNEDILKDAHAKYTEELRRLWKEAEQSIFTIDSLEDSLRLANSKQLAITNGPSGGAQATQQLLMLTQTPAVPVPTLQPETKDTTNENDDLFR